MLSYKYTDAITRGYPGVEFYCPDDGTVYETIVPLSGNQLPPKVELDAQMLSNMQSDMWRLIQAERDRRRSGGVLVGANWFHSDDTSRIQFLGLLMYGANMPAGIMWKTMSGNFVQMTPTLAQQIFGTIGATDTAIFTVAEQHKAAILSSQNPTAYNYLTGTPVWPAIYGE